MEEHTEGLNKEPKTPEVKSVSAEFTRLEILINHNSDEIDFAILAGLLTSKKITLAEYSELNAKYTQRLESIYKTLKINSGIDVLTGLYNRRAWDEKLPALVGRFNYEEGAPDSIMIIVLDIDYFKPFNDKYGHLIGDDALREVGRRIKKVTREWSDITFRWGGDEFTSVLVFPVTRDSNGKIIELDKEAIFKRIEKGIKDDLSVLVNGVKVDVQVSLGHAVLGKGKYENTKETAEQVFSQADAALYTSKEARVEKREQ